MALDVFTWVMGILSNFTLSLYEQELQEVISSEIINTRCWECPTCITDPLLPLNTQYNRPPVFALQIYQRVGQIVSFTCIGDVHERTTCCM